MRRSIRTSGPITSIRSPLPLLANSTTRSAWKSATSGGSSRTSILPINLNAVPYMMTMGGQTFAKAYANTVIGVLR